MPTPTRPPVLLTPIPEGTPPADLSWLYYVADTETGPELRVIGMDAQGRRWQESTAFNDLSLEGSGSIYDDALVGLHPSLDGSYLAAEVAYAGEMISVYIVELSSGRAWCPLAEPARCTGSFWDWTPDNRLLFRPFNVQPEDVILGGVIVVDPETGQYSQLDLPTKPDRSYSLVQNASLSPDGSSLAYSIKYSENKEKISEIWTMRMDGSNRQLVHRVKGAIRWGTLLWSPTGEQLIYVYQSKSGQFRPSELWLVNAEGGGERLLATNLPMPGEPRYRSAWSPDGRRVAFVQLDDPATFHDTLALVWGNVYVVDTVTGQITKLSSFEQRDITYPTWSPDGRFVAFVSTAIAGEETFYSEVWVASADGNQLYAVSGTAKWYNALAWLPSISVGEVR